jgi:hypothetical protein
VPVALAAAAHHPPHPAQRQPAAASVLQYAHQICHIRSVLQYAHQICQDSSAALVAAAKLTTSGVAPECPMIGSCDLTNLTNLTQLSDAGFAGAGPAPGAGAGDTGRQACAAMVSVACGGTNLLVLGRCTGSIYSIIRCETGHLPAAFF